MWFGSLLGRGPTDPSATYFFNIWFEDTHNQHNFIIKYSLSICWFIWKARCSLLFDNISLSPSTAILRISGFMAQYSQLVCPPTINNIDVADNNSGSLIWKPLEPNCTKINVDGAVNRGCSVAVAVERDQFGTIIRCSSVTLNSLDPILFEAQAFKCGLYLAIRSTSTQSVIEGDALNIVRWIIDQHLHPPWHIIHSIEECRSILDSHLYLKVSFAPRGTNTLAHCLAKKADSLSGS